MDILQRTKHGKWIFKASVHKGQKNPQTNDGSWNILQSLQKDNWEKYVEFV